MVSQSGMRKTKGKLGHLMLALFLVAATAGCQSRQFMMNAEFMDRGLVIVLPGIDGRAAHTERLCKTLCDDEIGMAVELYDWTLPLGGLVNQCAIERNHTMAGQLAERIHEYGQQFPGAPVFLIGHSGGTAIAIWAAEGLPDGESIDGIVLLASSLSPDYDLSRALCSTRGGIVSFYSSQDSALLGAGTILIGTMDGEHVESAGKVGFTAPSDGAGQAAYRKLHQIPWVANMAETGHTGGHFSCLAGDFVSAYVRPFVLADSWDDQMIQVVSAGEAAVYSTMVAAVP